MAWGLLVVLTVVAIGSVVTWDHTTQPTTGDENAYLLMALSLANDGHNLSLDAADAAEWRQLGLPWSPEAVGFYFRVDDEGFTAAKPYAYPLFLAPFIATLGFGLGLGVANAVLLLGVLTVSVAILRTRMRGPGVPLVVASFAFGSAMYFYLYAVAVELLFALVTSLAVLGFVRWWRAHQERPSSVDLPTGAALRPTSSLPWLVLAFAATGLMASEKPPLALVLCAPAALVVWRTAGCRRVVGPVVLVATFIVAVAPWLYYSDGTAYTPYAAPRFFARTTVMAETAPDDFLAALKPGETGVDSSSVFSPSGIIENASKAPGNIIPSAWFALVGRHTGLAVWAPLSLVALGWGVWRFRRLDPMGRAMVLAIGGYLVFYLVLFTNNFFGGSHSLGNRYFVQASPIVVGLIAYLGWTTRQAAALALGSLALSLVVLWPHHTQPRTAFLRIDRTSPVQELLPIGLDAPAWREFTCAQAYGFDLGCELPTTPAGG